jgi:hypothetical protein
MVAGDATNASLRELDVTSLQKKLAAQGAYLGTDV